MAVAQSVGPTLKKAGLKALLLLLYLCVWTTSHAEPIATDLGTNQPMKRIADGVFQVGKVRLDKNKNSITFPAVVNMTNGLVEYFVVSATGKLHESVLRSDVDPVHIHLAALLLGARGAQTNLTVQQFDTREIPGEKLSVTVIVQGQGGGRPIGAEQLVWNSGTNAAMTAGSWVYTGSQLHDGTFIAQRDGLIISIISDPLALINNPRPGRENDEIWQVNSRAVPPLNTPVEVQLQFLKETNK